MDTTSLRTLLAVAEAGSISRVAQQQQTSPSNISRQMTELERQVGAVLFQRTGRGVRPTPEGVLFIERARSVLSELDLAIAEVGDLHHNTTLRLRLSVPIEVALSLLPRSLACFYQSHSDVRMDIYTEARQVSLLEESYDAVIRLGPPKDSSLIARSLGKVDLLLCGHPSLQLQKPSIKNLQQLPFVGVTGTSEQLQASLQGRGFLLSLQPKLRLSTFSEAAEFALLSQHAVLLPSYTASRYLQDHRLVHIAPSLRLPHVEISMLCPQRHRKNQVLQAFSEILKKQLSTQGTKV